MRSRPKRTDRSSVSEVRCVPPSARYRGAGGSDGFRCGRIWSYGMEPRGASHPAPLSDAGSGSFRRRPPTGSGRAGIGRSIVSGRLHGRLSAFRRVWGRRLRRMRTVPSPQPLPLCVPVPGREKKRRAAGRAADALRSAAGKGFLPTAPVCAGNIRDDFRVRTFLFGPFR